MGADVLRLWVCSEDFRRDIPLSDEIPDRPLGLIVPYEIPSVFNSVHCMIFLLPQQGDVDQMSPIDLWVLSKTNDLICEVTDACENYEFHCAIQALNRFCSGVLSSTYHDVIKDRLYTLGTDDPLRRSTQSAILLVSKLLQN